MNVFFDDREMDNLSPQNVRHNCKIAFDAGEVLGIPRVIDPADMDVLTVPDKLAVMTYLYQLRAHFTGLQFIPSGNACDTTALCLLVFFYYRS